ncbi:hypothetical protein PHK61_06015 [Actinomycetospora lutea]|uniref:hypothetical protein n=1 Tax=Actinomycetospora lutea TaxID=663604 RepID=UPI0023668303|nr:hypothetical protein [Actinomycetospora lutea]MDD7937971.1 hypothetical protein [Actinomycetospora lutea]
MTVEIDRVDRARYLAAAERARRVYPGALGELVARELQAYAEFGFRLAGDLLVDRLAAEVLAEADRGSER